MLAGSVPGESSGKAWVSFVTSSAVKSRKFTSDCVSASLKAGTGTPEAKRKASSSPSCSWPDMSAPEPKRTAEGR